MAKGGKISGMKGRYWQISKRYWETQDKLLGANWRDNPHIPGKPDPSLSADDIVQLRAERDRLAKMMNDIVQKDPYLDEFGGDPPVAKKAKGGKVKSSSVRTAMDELKEYANALAPQRGMFSTLDELVQQAPFERAPVDQWKGFLQPGRMLKRNGMQFPLKKEELQYALEGPLRVTYGSDGPSGALTKEQLLNAIRTQRPEFSLDVARDTPGNKSAADIVSWLEKLGDPKAFVDQQAIANIPSDSRIQPTGTAYGPTGPYHDARLSHQSPGSAYEESITNLKGLDYQSHFDPSTISWSRTSSHDVPDLGKVRLIEELQSDLHRDASKRVGDFETQHGIRQGLQDAGLWEQYSALQKQEGSISRQRYELNSAIYDRSSLTQQEFRRIGEDIKALDEEATQLQDDKQNLINQAYESRPRRGYRSQEMLDDLKRQHETVRGEMNASVSGDSREYQTHDEKLSQAQDLVRRMGVEEEKPPDAPFKAPADYARLELRKQLVNAAKNDEDYLALTRPEDQIARYGSEVDEEDVKGMQHFYGEVYPSELQKLAKQYGAEVRDIDVPTSTGEDIRPDAMRYLGAENMREFMDLAFQGHWGGANDPFESVIDELTPRGTRYSRATTAYHAFKDAEQAGEDTSDALMDLSEAMEKLWYEYTEGRKVETEKVKSFPAIVLTPEIRQKILDTGVPVWSAAAGALLLGGHDDEAQAGEPKFAEGGDVAAEDYPGRALAEHIAGPERPARRALPSLRDLVKHIGHGFSTQWTGLDEQGVPQGLTNNDWASAGAGVGVWDADPQKAFRPEHPVVPGIVSDTLSVPDIVTLGHGPAWAKAASERAQALDTALRAQEGIGDPEGILEHAAEAGGVMAGQLPIPGRVAQGAIERVMGPLARLLPDALKESKVLRRVGKIPGAAAEWFSPTIDPGLGHYLAGTVAGTGLTMGLPKVADAVSERMDHDNPWRVAKRGVEAWEAATPEERERRHLLPPEILIELAQRKQPMELGDDESPAETPPGHLVRSGEALEPPTEFEPDEDDQAMISNLLGGSDAVQKR